jgi:hypothetical protein
MPATTGLAAAQRPPKTEALELSGAFLKTPNNHALEATYDSFTKIVFPDIPRPSLKGIDLVLEEMKELDVLGSLRQLSADALARSRPTTAQGTGPTTAQGPAQGRAACGHQ